jgi:DNA-binding winged helix-turn-helix (wHTH) protein
MTPNEDPSYEFDGFTLNPRDRLLFHLHKRIDLSGKDFDILSFMVRNPNVLIKNQDIEKAVWGSENRIHKGNVSNHIAKIRKALGCEAQHPRFIETSHSQKGYRFITPVRKMESAVPHGAVDLKRTRDSEIESHLIAPVFLGQGAFDSIRSPEIETTWAKYKEFKIDNGRLCVFQTGMGVWHLTGKHNFTSFTDAARWRSETYKNILSGKHSVQLYNTELRVPLISRASNMFASVFGKIGYVFSVMVLNEPAIARPESLRRPLQLLANLSSLESPDASAKFTEQPNLERELLNGTYSDLDTTEFGSPGRNLGFVTWDGLSYLEQADGPYSIKDEIIEFEIAVQSAWWLAKCLYDICLSNDSKLKKDLTLPIQDLRWQYSKLQGIVATESAAQRTMIEAILSTSRLHRLVEDTVRAYSQL